MNLSLADLKAYSSPFADWQAEFLVTMEELSDFSGDTDELLALLFNQVLPFVKHQYTLYDTLKPVLQILSGLTGRRSDCLEASMDFLSIVFQEPIRDSVQLLVEPIQYRYLQAEQTATTSTESSLFEEAKEFYKLRRSSMTSKSLLVYHDLTLLNRLEPLPTATVEPMTGYPDDRMQLTWLLADALYRYRGQGVFIPDSGVLITASQDRHIAAALQAKPFDEQALYQALRHEEMASIPWAGGRLGAIAGLTLFMASQQQSPQAASRTLQTLIECCSELKRSRSNSEDSPVTTDQFLLEDLSVALFRQHLRAVEPLNERTLDNQQRLFLQLLRQVYRGHTYTLLHAGVLPAGASSNEVGLDSSIYDAV